MEAGWKQVEKKDNIDEDEIKALFDIIDKDKSGSLTLRVFIHMSLIYKIFIPTVTRIH